MGRTKTLLEEVQQEPLLEFLTDQEWEFLVESKFGFGLAKTLAMHDKETVITIKNNRNESEFKSNL